MPEAPIIVVFDIDGTLLHSVTAHQCSLLRVYRALGVDVGARALSSFPDHTDSAIYSILVEERDASPASPDDLDALDAALDAEYRRCVSVDAPAEIAGARELLAALEADARFTVCFATGSMRGVATQKLAQLNVDGTLLVTASEYLTREQIVAAVIELALTAAGPVEEAAVISIGDGIWDMRTAANLGVPFIAVDSGTYDFSASGVVCVGDLHALSPDELTTLAESTKSFFTPPYNATKESH